MRTFERSLRRFATITRDRADHVLRSVGLSLLVNVVVGSPVRTGRFRGNWQIGVGARPRGELPRTSDPTAAEATKLLAAEAGSPDAGTVYIANNLPYATSLEWGHSRQAPAGMVRVAFANIRRIVQLAVAAARRSVR